VLVLIGLVGAAAVEAEVEMPVSVGMLYSLMLSYTVVLLANIRQ
jgi:hypothetical protein